jgi:hypothetical protein
MWLSPDWRYPSGVGMPVGKGLMPNSPISHPSVLIGLFGTKGLFGSVIWLH